MASLSPYTFTSDWFSNNLARWNTIVVPYLRSLKKPLKAMEIGVFEGRSALWTLENILTDRKSQMWLVDNFTRKNEKNVGCWQNLLKNLKSYRKNHPDQPFDKIMVCKGHIPDVLRSEDVKSQKFDFIYIDVHGTSKDFLEQAIMAWPMLSPGGMMVIDDYTSNREHDGACMKQGVDAFLDLYSKELEVRHMSWQVVLVKRKKNLPMRGCQSEYYTR